MAVKMSGLSTVLLWQLVILSVAQLATAEEKYSVASIPSLPFISEENETYTGFIPDFFKHITDSGSDCTFEFVNVRTNTGEVDQTWKGIERALRKNDVDIGVGPVTKGRVTDKKHSGRIHYTGKFADHEGWTVVIKRPSSVKRNIIKEALTLFRPFRVEVWLAILVAYAAVSVLLAIVNLINPYEWRGLYKREKVPKEDAHHLSPMGSIFIVYSTLAWQGYEKTPRSVAGRVLLIFWMSFVVVTLVSYVAGVANLMDSVAHERSLAPAPAIAHPYDLLDADNELRFGTVSSWPIIEHLESHGDPMARKLAHALKKHGENVKTVDEGLKMAIKGDYAFVVDTVIARYLTRDDCKVLKVGTIEPNDMTGYAFAIHRSDNPDRNDKMTCFNTAVDHLWKNEVARDLWRRWEKDYLYGRCAKEHELDSKPHPSPLPPFVALDIYQFCGPLALVGLGIVFCILISIAEILVHFIANKLQKVNILGASSPIEEERRLHDDLDDDLKA